MEGGSESLGAGRFDSAPGKREIEFMTLLFED